MGFDVKVLADSSSPSGHRLTTVETTFPRFVLAEFNTHRVFSRNSASSRAIPIAKQIRRVLVEPYVPIEFGSNQPGMQAGPPLTGDAQVAAEREWLRARDAAVRHVLALMTSPEEAADERDLLTCFERADAIRREAFKRAIATAFAQFARQIRRFDQRIQASSGRGYIAERI